MAALSGGWWPGPTLASEDDPTEAATDGLAVAASGLSLVDASTIQFRDQNEPQALAFDSALNLAFQNREHMGYPWVDLVARTLEVRPIDEMGRRAASLPAAALAAAGLKMLVTLGQASVAELDLIADDVTRLAATGIPDADLIWMTEPDQRDNRVAITISRSSSTLLAALAARYGQELIEVRVMAGGSAAAGARNDDGPPFWGGAKVFTPTATCTTGFAWDAAGQAAMLTAAHCIPDGGSISYQRYSNVGFVRTGYEENWNGTYGTQYYTGQSVYRGDVALIRFSSYGSAPSIYSGGPGTSTSSAVASMASRWSQVGDAACVNGYITGEWCGMVTATGMNMLYAFDGLNVWARHVDRAEALGNTCPTHGDSGAPVYRKLSAGRVTALASTAAACRSGSHASSTSRTSGTPGTTYQPRSRSPGSPRAGPCVTHSTVYGTAGSS